MPHTARNSPFLPQAACASVALFLGACDHRSQPKPSIPGPAPIPVSEVVIASPPNTPRPPFQFSEEDARLLDQVERGAFNYLWSAGAPGPGRRIGMAPDRTSKPTISVAAVGFQLSGICIGVERGWISRQQGEERVRLILSSLSENKLNRKAGVFYHFVDPNTAGQPAEAYEHVVSTIDSSLLFAGILTASQYFGGEVQSLGNALFEDADWKFFIAPPSAADPQTRGYLTLGWRPTSIEDPTGEGELITYSWLDSGDEHRLVTFLAVCAPKDDHRVDPKVYFRLRRQLGEYGDTGPLVWFPWSGALFTSFFAECWINYAGMGPDNPGEFFIPNRPRVDWWENSRRLARLHQLKSNEVAGKVPTFGKDAWGFTASDVKDGYAVPGVFPTPLPMYGALPQIDYPVVSVKDNYGDGTIAPYGASSCVMFDPQAAVAAMRYFRSLKKEDGSPLVWSDPETGGYGFYDAFNLGTGWVGKDCLGIDEGPLLLAIENARTGLVWRTFSAHPWVKAGMDRLRFQPLSAAYQPH